MLLTEENFSSRKTGVPEEHYHSELKEVTDEQFHRVLMDLYKEAASKWPMLTPSTEEWTKNKQIVIGVLACLPMCGEVPVQGFLLDYVASKEKENFTRTVALSSYLRVADAEEAKEVLLRFLVGEERMNSQARSSICEYARTAFMEADAEKKAAILESLYAALSKEDNKWLFRGYDNLLCELSTQYADSHQRLAILKRLINSPSLCKADDYALPELQEKLKVLQKTHLYTNISTNIVSLAVQNVNTPQPGFLTNSEKGDVREGPDTEPITEDAAGRSPGRRVLFGALALLLLGFGAWRFMWK
jgi:hypothetical protein